MATWKKVIVSGSNAELKQVTASGGFSGDGSGLTGISADSLANSLVDGNGIANFTFNGSAGATVALDLNGSTLNLASAGVKVADGGITATQLATSVAGAGLAGGGGTVLSVGVDGSSIEINSDALRVKASGITNTMLGGSIANAKLANDGITIAGVDTSLGGSISAAEILDGSAVISGSGGVVLALTAGGGIDIASNGTISGESATATNLGIAKFHTDNFAVASGGVTIKDGGVANVELANDGITIAGVDTSLGGTITAATILAGSAVISGSGGVAAALTAGVGIDIASNGTVTGEDATASNKGIAKFSTDNFTVSSGNVIIKNGGVANAELVNAGFTIAATDLALGGTITTATILKDSLVISGSGGIVGALTAGEGIDIAANGTVTGEDATASNKGIAKFTTDDFGVSSGAVTIKAGGVSNTQLAGSITTAKLAGSITNAKLSNSSITVGGTATSLGGTVTGAHIAAALNSNLGGSVTFGDSNDIVTIGNDLIVTGDLTINGDLTTVATTNLLVEDKFTTFASGSTSATDGGIIVQNSAAAGYALGYDTATTRWVFDNNLGISATDIAADAYVGTIQVSTAAASGNPTYGGSSKGHGTIHVDTNTGDIFIYA